MAKLCEEQLGRRDEAIAAWEQVLEGYPADADASRALERLYTAGERWVDLGELLEKRLRRVEQRGGHAAAGGAAELHGLELLAVLDAAADVEDDVAQRGAHGHLGEAAVDDLAGEAKALVPLHVVVAVGGVGVGAVGDDPGHVGPGLDVVDVGGLAPEAADRGERRPRARHAALALDGGDQRRLLATDERAGAFLDLEVEPPAAAEDVLAQQAALARPAAMAMRRRLTASGYSART